MLKALVLLAFVASTLGACGISGPTNVSTLSAVVGQELPGAQGLTLEDQHKIDDAMAGLCSANVYNRAQCDRHTAASAQRFSM